MVAIASAANGGPPIVFSSSIFLLLFMPLFFAGYYLLPWRRARNAWLLAGSLVFYAWGEPLYILLMLFSIACNWLFGVMLGRSDDERRRKAILVVAVIFNVLLIGVFKYQGFAAQTINSLIGTELVPDLELPLPIGISFYTLQALSYVIDVYRRHVPAQKNPALLAMYIACFPQLIAGPIVRYQTIADQLENRTETLEGVASGLRTFIVGLAKKVLLANVCAILAEKMLEFGAASIGAVGAWGGLIAYTFQIFFDFSGYSEMAIGLGRMMGFTFPKNFDYPYIARSITQFWRRWHISLSTFFRDYVYIPLGGSRVSTARNIANIAIVWAITGLWHGAAWNFVGWGVYYGALLIAEKFLWGDALKRTPAFIQHLYCLAVVMFGWSFFWIGDIEELQRFWKALAGCYGMTGTLTFWELTVWEYLPVFVVCALASVPVVPFIRERLEGWMGERETLLQIYGVACDAVLLVLLLASVASVVSGSFNPFIYFQF